MTPPHGDLTLAANVPGGRDRYHFHTRDGVHSPRAFRTTERLLLDALWGRDLGRLLVPQANYGVVGVVLAANARTVTLTEASARARALCDQNAARNDVHLTTQLAAAATAVDATVDTVAYAPKPDTPIEVGRHRIAAALASLAPGGRCYVSAAPRTGLNRYETTLRDLAESVQTLESHDGYEVLEATVAAPPAPRSLVTPNSFSPTVDGVSATVYTVPGLFSPTGLDDGTRLLLQAARVDPDDRVLDLCCGAGPIGAIVGQRIDGDLWLTDDDRAATRCARCTLDATGVDGTVVTADCTAGVSDHTFDTVLCNPPTHAGDGVLTDLIAGAHEVLARDGDLFLVNHRSLDLTRFLRMFETVRRTTVGAEHVVLHATRNG